MNCDIKTKLERTYDSIFKYINDTDTIVSKALSSLEQQVYYKLENEQEAVNSFKIRGALNILLNLKDEEKNKRLATISSGNNGISLSYASKLLNLKPPLIIVPKTVSPSKIRLIESLGGQVIKLGKDYDEAHKLGSQYIDDMGCIDVDPNYSDLRIIYGQASILLSLIKQVKNLDTVIVPIGGGQLIGGILLAREVFAPKVKVIGVQTKACPAMYAALKNDKYYPDFESKPSICKALVGGVSLDGYKICKRHLDGLILVSETEILDSFRKAYFYENILIEPSSATVMAALRYHRQKILGKTVVAVLTGGNIDNNEKVQLLG